MPADTASQPPKIPARNVIQAEAVDSIPKPAPRRDLHQSTQDPWNLTQTGPSLLDDMPSQFANQDNCDDPFSVPASSTKVGSDPFVICGSQNAILQPVVVNQNGSSAPQAAPPAALPAAQSTVEIKAPPVKPRSQIEGKAPPITSKVQLDTEESYISPRPQVEAVPIVPRPHAAGEGPPIVPRPQPQCDAPPMALPSTNVRPPIVPHPEGKSSASLLTNISGTSLQEDDLPSPTGPPPDVPVEVSAAPPRVTPRAGLASPPLEPPKIPARPTQQPPPIPPRR